MKYKQTNYWANQNEITSAPFNLDELCWKKSPPTWYGQWKATSNDRPFALLVIIKIKKRADEKSSFKNGDIWGWEAAREPVKRFDEICIDGQRRFLHHANPRCSYYGILFLSLGLRNDGWY